MSLSAAGTGFLVAGQFRIRDSVDWGKVIGLWERVYRVYRVGTTGGADPLLQDLSDNTQGLNPIALHTHHPLTETQW